MSSYISFLESLVKDLKYGSIEDRWKFWIAEEDREKAAIAIKEYIKQYGHSKYFFERKVWDTNKKEIVVHPAETFFSFPFITKGPLTKPANCILLYDFFFRPKSTKVEHVWKYN